jgi:hypothetical protein
VPGGFVTDHTYYVVHPAANTFQLSLTPGGAAVVPTNAGGGNLPFCPLEIGGFPNGSTTWASDAALRSLHPIFILTFFPGYSSGVKVDYVVTSDWTTALQDQRYAITLLGDPGNVTAKFTHAEFPHYAMTRWRKTYWSGTALKDVKIDHNLSYLASTGVIPNYDPAETVTAAQINADTTSWNNSTFGGIASDQCSPFDSQIPEVASGGFVKYMGTTGQTTADYIGIIPAWQARWLYGMSNPAVDNSQFNGPTMQTLTCGGNVPVHLWESATGRWYDSGHTIDAFGRPVSIDARPNIRFNIGTGPDDIVFVRSSSHGWTYDAAHQPSYGYFEYLMTGDWYALQEMVSWNSYNFVPINPGINLPYGRAASWGYFNDGAIDTRGAAWTTRSLVQISASAPDGSPEQAYFSEKLTNNIAINEGRFNITNGAFPPANAACPNFNVNTTTDKWCWGNKEPSQNPWGDGITRFSPLGVIAVGSPSVCDNNWIQNYLPNAPCQHPWQLYFLYAAWGHAMDQGFSTGPLLAWGAKAWISAILDPAFNPYLVDDYSWVFQDNNKAFLTNWGGADSTGMKYYLTNNSRTDWMTNGTLHAQPGPSDYANIFKGVFSWARAYSVGGYRGADAWSWLLTHVPNTGAGGNPKWDFVPRIAPRGPAVRGRAAAAGGIRIH